MALELGVDVFLDLQADSLEDAGQVDVVFDVIGGDIMDRSAALVRPGGTLVAIASPPTVRPRKGRRSSSSSNPIASSSRTWPGGSGTDGSARWSGPCERSPRRPPRSPSTPPARRSSGSRKANSRLSRRRPCIGS
ncbi:zinc-binding dehydrogenase [Nonomuraea sp. LPB2021202275-12-8]|uniref:zinc-binding dehydrogenase n=1 Tax=Nonomuraea sp. LPB2021202275-12-8 TaxID=3120159 RepID=UPI003FA5D457